jgi:hypothetical protein
LTAGCGGDNQEASSVLVRLDYKGTLDFGADEIDGSGQVVHLDESTVINRDGDGSRTSVAFDGSRGFQVSQTELGRLEHALSQIDLQDLKARFAAQKGDASTETLTYGGETVVLGDRLSTAGHSEGDEQADRYSHVTGMIDRLSAKALPASIKRANRRAARETKQLERRLRPIRRPTCEKAREFVHDTRPSAHLERKIYSHVRPSEQPCP